MKGPVRVEGFLLSNAILRDASFSTFDLAGHLRAIDAQTDKDFGPLVHSAANNPFFLEGPRLRTLHILVARLLAPNRMPLWQPLVEQAVDTHLDLLSTHEHPDLIRHFVDPVFRTVMGSVLGFDATDADQFSRWARQARDFLQPLLSLRRLAALKITIDEISKHLQQTAFASAPGAPKPVSVELLEHLSDDFTRDDAIALVTVLMIVGQATPTTLGNMILYVLLLPEERRKDATGEHAFAWFADKGEMVLRLSSAIQAIGRVALEERTIDGQEFLPGELLHLDVPSANHDGSVFPMEDGCPMAKRSSSADHLVFGSGRHVCPGASLARLIIGTALPRLFQRYPHTTLTGEPTWDQSTFLRYTTFLPCQL